MRAARSGKLGQGLVTGAVAMAWTLGVALDVFAQTPTSAQKRLFASLGQELIDKLQASGKFSSIRHADPQTLVARMHDGKQTDVSLIALAVEVAARPSERARFVERVIGSVLAAAQPAAADIDKAAFLGSLRIIVRHADHLKRAAGRLQSMPLWRPIAGDAIAIVATIDGEQTSVVMAGQGSKYGVGDDELFDAAMQQMQRYVEGHTFEDAARVRVLLANDENYSPTLLLLPDVRARVERDFGADFLVAIPDRTVLLVAPADNAAGLAATVAALTRQHKTNPHIPHFIQRVGDGWKPVPRR